MFHKKIGNITKYYVKLHSAFTVEAAKQVEHGIACTESNGVQRNFNPFFGIGGF